MSQTNQHVSFEDVTGVVAKTLGVQDQAPSFTPATELLGNLPEFDSFAVVEVIAALEDRFGITIEDDDVTAEVFETFGALADFVDAKLR
ncbi:MAG TPA: acyl carrier protein [Pseudonocardiaceae bacterium]